MRGAGQFRLEKISPRVTMRCILHLGSLSGLHTLPQVTRISENVSSDSQLTPEESVSLLENQWTQYSSRVSASPVLDPM